MRDDPDRFRSLDDAALRNALLRMRVCIQCRGDLEPTRSAKVWACDPCDASYFVPDDGSTEGHDPDSRDMIGSMRRWKG